MGAWVALLAGASFAAADEGEIRGIIVQSIEKGAKPAIYIDLFGRRLRGRVTAADDDGITATVLGNQVGVGWNEMGKERLLRLARRCASMEDKRHVLLLARFAVEKGMREADDLCYRLRVLDPGAAEELAARLEPTPTPSKAAVAIPRPSGKRARGLEGVRGIGHPRLWIEGEAGIERLRRRIREIPSVRRRYERIRDHAKTATVDTSNLYTVATRVQTLALAYLIEGRDKRILAKLRKYADVCCNPPGAHGFTDPRCLMSLAFIYDWCHPDLSDAERRRYFDGIKMLRKRITSRWHHSDYNNHQYLEYGPMLYAGLAFYGDGIDDAAAKSMADWGREFIFNHGVKAVNQVSGPDGDGGWHESRSYHGFFFYEMAFQWEAWRTATGEDPFAVCKGLSGDAAWMLHTNRPHDGGAVGVADIEAYDRPYTLGWTQDYYMPLVAARYRDPVAQYLAETIKPSRYDYRLFPHVLWYDPEVKAAKLTDLPTARVFRGLGWAAMRSSWEKDAAYCLFISADYYAGHQHMEQNGILVHKLGNLVIDACQYGAKDTRYHNTILIGGSQRPFTTDPVRRFRPVEKGGPFDCGDILAWEDRSPHYTYVCGECSNAYPEGKVKWFSRQLVFCRPDIFVVFDRTVTPRPEPREWLLHSLKPAKLGPDSITIADAGGKLLSKTLLPNEVKISQEPIRGGMRNHTHNHIRVVPVRNDVRSLNFLTVLHASPAGSKETPECGLVGESGVEVRFKGKVWKIVFGSHGPPSGHIRISEGDKVLCAQDLTQEVNPNAR